MEQAIIKAKGKRQKAKGKRQKERVESNATFYHKGVRGIFYFL
jgi:hypothetical protein